MTGDFSEFTKKEDELFRQYIKILQDWRITLWDSSLLGTSSFLATNIKDICDLKDDMADFNFASEEVVEEFEKEFYMTMHLLEKCLIKSERKKMTPSSDEYKIAVEEIKSKLSEYSDSIHGEEILTALREEDPTAHKALEQLGLESEAIERVLVSGYKVDSVLDEVSTADLKRS